MLASFTAVYEYPDEGTNVIILSLIPGTWGDHVPAVQLQSGPLELGHHRLSMLDRQGPVPGPDSSGAQELLREERQSVS